MDAKDNSLKITFKSSLDDAIFAHMQLLSSFKSTKRNKYMGLLGAPIFFIVVYLSEKNLPLSLIIAGIYAVLYWFLYPRITHKHIKNALVEARGSEKPLDAEYELTPKQLIYRENAHSTAFDWSTLIDIKQHDHYTQLHFSPKGVAILRHTYFRDENERKIWIDFIEKKLEVSKQKERS